MGDAVKLERRVKGHWQSTPSVSLLSFYYVVHGGIRGSRGGR